MQNSSRLTLEDGTIVTACDNCKEVYKQRKAAPPCETCMVELMPENYDAMKVYMDCRNQKIFEMKLAENGMPYSQLIDINITAVKDSMWIHRVKDREECLSKVKRAFYHFESQRGE